MARPNEPFQPQLSDVSKTDVTIYGRRNWEKLLTFAVRKPDDFQARRGLADSLAALVSEVTPLHREVLASMYAKTGARGRMFTHVLPPGLSGEDRAQTERWAALVFLDCVDYAADMLAKDHSLLERQKWRAAAEKYTCGAERYGRQS